MSMDPERPIPGAQPRQGRWYFYLESSGLAAFRDFFPQVTSCGKSPLPASGGAINEEVGLVVPGGQVLCAISYKGDAAGWRRKLLECAEERRLLWAEITGATLQLSDGRKLDLAACEVIRG